VQIDDTKDGDTLIASISGDVDVQCWSQLQEWMERLRAHRGPVVLDAHEVGFCDSIMLRFLVGLREKVPHFSLRSPSADLRVVLESAGLLGAFHLDA
jgi:anti-anti-sigma factor